MITVQRTILAHRPVEQVFAYLRDFTNTEQWDPGTIRTTRADDGPLREGARFRNISEFRGRRTVLDYELAELETERHLRFVGRNKTVTATDDLTFRHDDGGTAVVYRATLQFHGFARLAEPLLRRNFEQLADATEHRLAESLAGLTASSETH